MPPSVHISTSPATPAASIPDDVSESGFDFEEALNPTDDLEEIMKAFDFYNEIAPIYCKQRNLAASKLNSCTVDHSIVAEGLRAGIAYSS